MEDIIGYVVKDLKTGKPARNAILHAVSGVQTVWLTQHGANSEKNTLLVLNVTMQLEVVPVRISEVLAPQPVGPDIQTGL